MGGTVVLSRKGPEVFGEQVHETLDSNAMSVPREFVRADGYVPAAYGRLLLLPVRYGLAHQGAAGCAHVCQTWSWIVAKIKGVSTTHCPACDLQSWTRTRVLDHVARSAVCSRSVSWITRKLKERACLRARAAKGCAHTLPTSCFHLSSRCLWLSPRAVLCAFLQ